MARRQIDWTNTLFLAFAHAMAVAGIIWLAMNWHWQTAALGLGWFALCGLGITAGYHRLFAHPTYKAIAPLRALYLVFGAASVQNSALKWSADHRRHHRKTDRPEDPYNIKRGFWWAHVGWVLAKQETNSDLATVHDLSKDRLIYWQHRLYVPLAIVVGVAIPGALGLLWGDPIGAILVVGFLRLALQWHSTFMVNSVAHMLGTQPYGQETSARDSWVTALVTLGEGYHNFHHRFQSDYRNGIRWFHFDPTKWFVWCMSKVGVTRDLKRVPRSTIERARKTMANAA